MQESNGFLPDEDGLDHFERTEGTLVGDQVLRELNQRNDEMKGFVNAVRASGADVEVVPILSASGIAGGLVAADVVDYFEETMRDQLRRAGRLDGVLMALHGAMASADSRDLDGYFLSVVQQELGGAVPVVCSLDMHAIVTQQMVNAASALVAYRTHPHIDVVETGERAGGLLMKMLRGDASPIMATQKIPLLIPPLDDGTNSGALKELFDRVTELSQVEGVLDCSLCCSYCWLDAEEQGWTVLAVTDNDRELGERMARQLAEEIWPLREQLLPEPMLEPAEAVRAAAAAAGHPIIITDSADTAGGGGPGDTTGLLKAILAERHVVDGLILLHMTDAKAIEGIAASDVGSVVTIKLGNTSGARFGGLLSVTGQVLEVTAGPIEDVGGFGRLGSVDTGKIVCLAVDNFRLVVTQSRTLGPQPSLFRKVRIEPFEAKVVALKTGVGYRATYGHVLKGKFHADCPGVVSYNLSSFDYRRINRPIYPLDMEMEWQAK